MIRVTRPYLPPWEDFEAHLREVWSSAWLTNFGPKHQALEANLTDHAGTPALLVTNGTLALNVAARALELGGEVITTPFTYVATASAMAWEGLTPRFVDIDPETLNLDPRAIERAITPETSAIVATHVYGNPCDVAAIRRIADAHGLKVIYDAAHCFGVRHKGRSLFAFGDVATLSLQATKLFHTAEGGAVFVADPEVRERATLIRDFGGRQPPEYQVPGLNVKISEIHAALGLAIWPHMVDVLDARRRQGEQYRARLDGAVAFPRIADDTVWNHHYVPVLFRTEEELQRVVAALAAIDVEPRRYFHPCLTRVPWAPMADTPVAEHASRTVLCMPVFHDLALETVDHICDVVMETVEAGLPV